MQRAELIKQDPVSLSRGASLVMWLQRMCGHRAVAMPHLPLAQGDPQPPSAQSPGLRNFPGAYSYEGLWESTRDQRVPLSPVSSGTLEWLQSVSREVGALAIGQPIHSKPSFRIRESFSLSNKPTNCPEQNGQHVALSWFCFRAVLFRQ